MWKNSCFVPTYISKLKPFNPSHLVHGILCSLSAEIDWSDWHIMYLINYSGCPRFSVQHFDRFLIIEPTTPRSVVFSGRKIFCGCLKQLRDCSLNVLNMKNIASLTRSQLTQTHCIIFTKRVWVSKTKITDIKITTNKNMVSELSS